MYQYYFTDELYHHGIPGMRWGVRRFQNEDGSLTPRGEKRYEKGEKLMKKGQTIEKNKRKVRKVALGITIAAAATAAATLAAPKIIDKYSDMQFDKWRSGKAGSMKAYDRMKKSAEIGRFIKGNKNHILSGIIGAAGASTFGYAAKKQRDNNSIRIAKHGKKKN